MIGAVVLAAGSSFRMGTPKALLEIGEKTFLQHVVDVIRSADVEEVVVVLGHDAPGIKLTMTWFEGRTAINEEWGRGQLSSMIAGLNAFEEPGPQGVLFWPVDHPLVPPDLIKELLEAFRDSGKAIIIPEYEGRRGHPVIFRASLYDELRDADPRIGAREVIRRHPDDIHTVPTDHKGVLVNIDTPGDYSTHILSGGPGIG